MNQLITALHPYNPGHTLTEGDVKSIDGDRIEIAKLHALVKTLRRNRYEILGLLEACVKYISGYDDPENTPDFVIVAYEIVQRFKP